jgi:hypothetical protein
MSAIGLGVLLRLGYVNSVTGSGSHVGVRHVGCYCANSRVEVSDRYSIDGKEQ